MSAIALPPLLYRAFWSFAFVTHVLTGSLLLTLTLAHALLSLPDTQKNTTALMAPVELLRVGALLYGVFTVAHFASAAQMLRHSIKHGSIARRMSAVKPEPTRQPTVADVARSHSRMRRLYRQVKNRVASMLTVLGYVSLGGPFFDSWLLLREVIEILLQSYQLWTLSYSVTHTWINHFAVSLVVLNCWSLPAVAYVFREHETTRRLMHLVVDFCLDFGCSVIVPLMIAIPFVMAFDWNRLMFPMYLILDPVWLATGLSEGKQVMITSNLDLVSSCMPQYSLLACLRLLKRSIHSRSPTSSSLVAKTATTSSDSVTAIRPTQSRISQIVLGATALWGFVVLGLHIHAFTFKYPADDGCLLVVRQWLPTNKSCSVFFVDCEARGIQGSRDEITPILAELERGVVTRIGFRQCTALDVPPIIRDFPALGAINFVFSTIDEWSEDAAITAATNPVLSSASFADSNVSTLLPGMYHRQLPLFLQLIMFTRSGISFIPDDIGDVLGGRRMNRLSIESANVTDIPLSFGRLDQDELMLTSNWITRFPEAIFAHSHFSSVRLSGNPLQQLPETIGDTSKLKELLVEHTNVSVIPPWAAAWLDDHRTTGITSFFGSPVCSGFNSTIQAWGICDRDYHSRFGFEMADVMNHPPPQE